MLLIKGSLYHTSRSSPPNYTDVTTTLFTKTKKHFLCRFLRFALRRGLRGHTADNVMATYENISILIILGLSLLFKCERTKTFLYSK